MNTSLDKDPSDIRIDALPPALPFPDALLLILIVLAGVLLTLNLLPLWLPGLTQSVSGADPKIFWFLSRGSAVVAFWLLWLSMTMGVTMTNKMAQIWPGIPPAYEVHQYTSLLGLGFALFHALILTGDHFIKFTALTVLIPFTSHDYRPVWVGIGQVAFYVWVVVAFTFYIRGKIGAKTWRLIHLGSYASFLAVMVHGIYSGTDTAAVWTYYSYWFSGGSLLFLTIFRILAARFPATAEKRKKNVENG
jgi:predicted ferric reductase